MSLCAYLLGVGQETMQYENNLFFVSACDVANATLVNHVNSVSRLYLSRLHNCSHLLPQISYNNFLYYAVMILVFA